MATSMPNDSSRTADPAVRPRAPGPVLLTGGTGFLGEHLLRALRGAGQAVRVLCREPTPELAELGASVYQGDLISTANRAEPPAPPTPPKLQDEPAWAAPESAADDALAAALDGVQEVYHLAGMVSRDPERAQAMMQIHVDGTRRLLHAAKAAGVRRVLLASTSGTIAISRDPEPVPDETWPYPVDLCGNWPYYLSKIYQEKLALELAPRLGLEMVVVNPSLLLGPGDRRGSSTGDVRDFLCGEVPIIPSGGVSFVDARDAASACVVAMEKGRNGERYLLGVANWTFAEFFGRLERLSKVDGPRLKIPERWNKAVARLTGAIETAYRHRGHDAPLSRIAVEMSQHFWYCDSSKAERELGFAPRDPQETLDATIRDIRPSVPPR